MSHVIQNTKFNGYKPDPAPDPEPAPPTDPKPTPDPTPNPPAYKEPLSMVESGSCSCRD